MTITRARLAWLVAFVTRVTLAATASCGDGASSTDGPSSFHVDITAVDGSAELPTAEEPLPANHGDTTAAWAFAIEARTATGALDETFDGMVRLSTRPGAITAIVGDGALGRNVRLVAGKATGEAQITAVYGPSRLWVEDIGYTPAPAGKKPACSNGKNDDGAEDGLVDFPADPGCAFADDDTEESGTFAVGVSLPVQYALPTVADLQGNGSTSPYPFEAIEVNTQAPQRVVVTRVASDGFYVTDVSPDAVAGGYNSLFAFNFSTPPGMRVCDRVAYLAGTVNEFFGFTELSFPSYQLEYPIEGVEACEVPEPTVLDDKIIADPVTMEKLESGLVRIQGFHVAKNFGSKPAKSNVFAPDQSSCDLNGDGRVDFESEAENKCSKACATNGECSEWTAFVARGNYMVTNGKSAIQIQTGAVAAFDPTSSQGLVLDAVTGTMRNFSGGSLNWTIEARCPDDVACGSNGCVAAPLPSQTACVRLRSIDDNDQGTN